jgi:hypothetical protein
VAEIASWLADQAARRGIAVDRRVVEAAALLHDVDKLPAVRRMIGDSSHGEGSATWVTRHGAPELAEPVRNHPVTLLADETSARRILTAPLEVRLVAYADKRAGQRLGTMDARFRSWQRRYPDGWDPSLRRMIRMRAAELERGVLDELGVEATSLRRLRWTPRAMAAA